MYNTEIQFSRTKVVSNLAFLFQHTSIEIVLDKSCEILSEENLRLFSDLI